MLPDLQPPFNDEHVDTCVACAGALYPTSKPLSATSTTAAQHMGMA